MIQISSNDINLKINMLASHTWQLQGMPAQSWAECERHAENLRLLLGEPIQKDLFGNIVDPKKRGK